MTNPENDPLSASHVAEFNRHSPGRRTLLKSIAVGGAAIAFAQTAYSKASTPVRRLLGVVNREGRVSALEVGDRVQVSMRYPIGHYRTPFYLRGKRGQVIRVVEQYINPEEEAFGRNAGTQLWLYQVRFKQSELFPEAMSSPSDYVQLEIFENWLEKA